MWDFQFSLGKTVSALGCMVITTILFRTTFGLEGPGFRFKRPAETDFSLDLSNPNKEKHALNMK